MTVGTQAAGSEDVVQIGLNSVWHPLTQHAGLRDAPPMHVVRAEGCVLTDDHGREVIDALSGLWCVNVGYGRRELAEVAARQMQELAYLAPTMSHEPGIRLARKILDLLGMEGHVYLAGSGSEANEAAFKIARQYHRQVGEAQRYKIIARYRGYHGNTLGAMAATGQAERKSGYDPMPAGFLHVPPPYPYRRHPKLSEAEHGEEAARWLDEAIQYEGAETVAAFIMEPIISGGGVIVPPDNYVDAIRRVCDRHGVLLIFDEVVSGFGRTGAMFGHQHWTATADIVTMAKGIASGYMPVSAVAVNERIFEAFLGEPSTLRHFRHVNTYGGHPVAAAVALRNIEIIEREGLVENAERMGTRLRDHLAALESSPIVGEVRGKGLLFGIELVADNARKQPLEPARVARVLHGCRTRDVLIGRNGNTVPGLANVLIVAPPLVADSTVIDRIAAAIEAGVDSA